MPKREDSENKTDRSVLDYHAQYMAEKYKAVKLSMPTPEAEALKEYCDKMGVSVAGLIRELVKQEIASAAKSEDGAGKMVQRIRKSKAKD